jgi:hypothetical protein
MGSKFLKRVLGIVFVQWCIYRARGYSVEANPFFGILNRETRDQGIQATPS